MLNFLRALTVHPPHLPAQRSPSDGADVISIPIGADEVPTLVVALPNTGGTRTTSLPLRLVQRHAPPKEVGVVGI